MLISRLLITSLLRRPSEHHDMVHRSQWVTAKVRAESDDSALIETYSFAPLLSNAKDCTLIAEVTTARNTFSYAIAISLRPMHAAVSGKVCADRPGRMYTNNVSFAIPAYYIRTAAIGYSVQTVQERRFRHWWWRCADVDTLPIVISRGICLSHACPKHLRTVLCMAITSPVILYLMSFVNTGQVGTCQESLLSV